MYWLSVLYYFEAKFGPYKMGQKHFSHQSRLHFCGIITIDRERNEEILEELKA